MIVTRENFEETLSKLESEPSLSLDTETTGLRPYHGDRFFSIIIASPFTAYYFNWNEYPELEDKFRLDTTHRAKLNTFFKTERTWFLHNAKFDMAMLAQDGLSLKGDIHDTMVTARLLNSELFANELSLAACASKIGFKKDDKVMEWLKANKCFTTSIKTGKKIKLKNYKFAEVPWEIITPYGAKDATITYSLAEYQIDKLSEETKGVPPLDDLYKNEKKLVQAVFKMEQRGVLINRQYCKEAAAWYEGHLASSMSEFQRLTGEEFKDSSKMFKEVFEDEDWIMGKLTPTGKQNPKFGGDNMAHFKNPAAKAVLAYRKAKATINFFETFQYESDRHDRIHTNFNQHGTVTGRFSSSSPNLQNLTKESVEDTAYPVRRAIVPAPGNVFHMLDYDQMEYRLMLDYAGRLAPNVPGEPEGVLKLIQLVNGGLDVHQATADSANISRSDAKTTNFSVLYGAGLATLAGRLEVSILEATAIRNAIFRAAPEIKTFLRLVAGKAEKRGFVFNWFGRRYTMSNANFSYRAPNYLIQGGCADIVKIAMVRVHSLLCTTNCKLVLTIHDELVIEGPPEESAQLIPRVKEIMESVYPHKFVKLTCGIDHSYKSLADKESGICKY